MTFYFLKAFHIIGVVCWFAGLFYIVRLFIYDVEASHKVEPDKSILQKQFRLMQKRLWYGITVPSMVITILCGLGLIFLMPYYLKSPNYWMHVKLVVVLLLMVYHYNCSTIMAQLKAGSCKKTSKQLRVYNEYASLLLCASVFLIVLRSIVATLIATSVLFFLGMAVFLIYSKIRNKSPG